MKIAVIKHLAENTALEDLRKAASAMEEGFDLPFDVEGDDEGEQLTHLLASIWVKEEMERNGNDVRAAIRSYSLKVRNSIN